MVACFVAFASPHPDGRGPCGTRQECLTGRSERGLAFESRGTATPGAKLTPIDPQDTIVAVSTPPGRGGIGVVRLSGTKTLELTEKLVSTKAPKTFEPRVATRGELVDGEGRGVDQVLVTFFRGPNSYTGEDVAEISCHGAPVVLAFAVERAMELGARLAEPGEFTQRAFFNGLIDLAQAEAVRDLIEATTVYQARVALQQVEGALSRRLTSPKNQLCELIALLEAGIDFAEDDVPVAADAEILGRLRPLMADIEKLAESYRFGKVVRGGITLSILGRPNVGKSSLFNRLLEQDRAIVTATPGTTRDQVSETLVVEGLPVRLIDTAGIRATSDVVETKGVEKSYEALADADLILVVLDLSQPLQDTDRELLAWEEKGCRSLVVANKSDLPGKAEVGRPYLAVSATTGDGIPELRRQIYQHAVPDHSEGAEAGFITNIRHAQLLRDSLEQLKTAERAVAARVPHEMLLLDLYAALKPIDAITGATTIEDILDNIFSTFCIGK